MNVDFTPLLPSLRQAVTSDLSSLLGVTLEDWEDRARHRPGDGWAVLVRLDGGLAVELSTPGSDRVFATGPALALSYRRLEDGREPTQVSPHRELLEGLASRVRQLGVAEVAVAREALTRWRRYAPTQDYMFVQANDAEVVVRLGFRCNQDCGFCWQARDWPDAPPSLVRTWLDEMAAAGRRLVMLSGGEPTVYKALPDVIRHAKSLGMQVLLQTNAVRLAKASYLASLVDAGLDGAFVSLHSADAAVSDAITRAAGTYERTALGIENMLAAGLSVELNCVVDKRNYRRLEHHAATIIERFVAAFAANPVGRVSYSHPCEAFDPTVFDDTVVGLDLVKPHLVAALRLLQQHDVAVSGIGTCGFPPCLLAEAPELLQWLDPQAQHAMDVAGRVYGEPCAQCAVREGCLGLRSEYVERLGARGIVPFRRSPLPHPSGL